MDNWKFEANEKLKNIEKIDYDYIKRVGNLLQVSMKDAILMVMHFVCV